MNVARVIPNRMTAEIEGDFVVFLIGMRFNKPWKIHKWLPVLLAMPRMLRELEARPESGFLGHTPGFTVIVQYWRSFEHLEAVRANSGPPALARMGGVQQACRKQPGGRGHLARNVSGPRR